MAIGMQAYRRTLIGTAIWAVAMLTVGLFAAAPAARGQGSPSPGLGNATAQGIRVDPRSGGLSFGITYGVALAGHQNSVASADARSIDLGVIGLVLAGEACDGGDPTLAEEDQPQHLRARSSDDAAGSEQTEVEYGVEKRVYVDESPVARASALTTAVAEDGVFRIGSTRSEVTSGIVDGKRVARAVTEVDSIDLLAGVVEITGLRWEATYQTAPEELIEGSFSIEGIDIFGYDNLTFPGDDPLAGLAQANAVLEPLGMVIEPPEVIEGGGIEKVTPMRIAVVPANLKDDAVGVVTNALAPVREPIVDALIAARCGNATEISIADIALGSLTGAGSFALEVGGVVASSRAIEAPDFGTGVSGSAPDIALPAVTPAAAGPSPFVSDAGTASTSPAPSPVPSAGVGVGPAPTVGPPAPIAAGSNPLVLASSDSVAGERGGSLALVGLAGLGALAWMALADRARMRRAQRTITWS